MKRLIRHGGLGLLLWCCWLPAARAQLPPGDSASPRDKILRIAVTNIGPAVASESLVRANLRVKEGDVYDFRAVNQDIKNLYDTGFFTESIRTSVQRTDEGIVLTFILEGKPRISGINFEGNTVFSSDKMRKKISSRPNDPLDQMKLFNDTMTLQQMYEKAGYTHTVVKYEEVNMDRAAGQVGVLFQVTETPKIKIEDVVFTGAHAYSQRKLRGLLKTRRHWIFSWITGKGVFKQEDWEDDQDTLVDFYKKAGYIDFEVKATNITYPTPKRMEIEFVLEEGRQYRLGTVTFKDATLLPTNAVERGFSPGKSPKTGTRAELDEWRRVYALSRSFSMKTGDIFTMDGLKKDRDAVQDYYGSKGYIIGIDKGDTGLNLRQIPNLQTGTIDLEFKLTEGQKFRIEKVIIQGNVRTKDRVLRRELTVSPGDTFDMVQVRLSQERLEGLTYFTRGSVKAQPQDDPSLTESKNLVINVEEQSTGNMNFGAGYNTVESISAMFSVEQRNFDLFNPPYFTGAGQKLRLNVQVGTLLQNYQLTFQEPWLFDRHLIFDASIYRNVSSYLSPDNLYDESRTGLSLGLTRALGTERLVGNLNYSLEDVDIFNLSPNSPDIIAQESGNYLFNRFGASIAYDTENSILLPNGGQRTALSSTLTVGDVSYVKLELSSAWYFKGLFPGHVLELVGKAGVAQKIGNRDVPFFDRYYLGGLYDLRGYEYRLVGPSAVTQDGTTYEPIGGDTFWFGSAEYSIPIIERLRFALFYDIGNVSQRPWSNSGMDVAGRGNEENAGPFGPGFLYFPAGNTGDYSDNYGFGIHLDIPQMPLRLDFGIPIHHSTFTSGGGKFQFGVGFKRPL